MCYLWKEWNIRGLPVVSAILSILYPTEFTVYDVNVCKVLGEFGNLKNRVNFENVWRGYKAFKQAVEESAPEDLILRDKDRYLWAKAFDEQLRWNIKHGFKGE